MSGQLFLGLSWETKVTRHADGSYQVRPGKLRDVHAPCTVRDAAQRLGLDERTVRLMCESGELVAWKPRLRVWKIDVQFLHAYLLFRKGQISEMDLRSIRSKIEGRTHF